MTQVYSWPFATSPCSGPVAGKWALQPFQLAVLVGIGVTYTVVAGTCLAAFSEHVTSSGGINLLGGMLIFGIMEVLLSLVSGILITHKAILLPLHIQKDERSRERAMQGGACGALPRKVKGGAHNVTELRWANRRMSIHVREHPPLHHADASIWSEYGVIMM
jgi:hypothetical protein